MNLKTVRDYLRRCRMLDILFPHTRRNTYRYLHNLRQFPTPSLGVCDDGAIEMRWENGGRLFQAFVKGLDLNIGAYVTDPREKLPEELGDGSCVIASSVLMLRWVTRRQEGEVDVI